MAISLRPEYFDAIEHLVGLLCHDRRNKEAVKVIEQFQAFLNSNQHNYTVIDKYDLWGVDVGHIINLLHAKGNLLYIMQDHAGAAKSFEDVVLIAVGDHFSCVRSTDSDYHNLPYPTSAKTLLKILNRLCSCLQKRQSRL